MSRPRAVVLTAPGTNRQRDVAFALDLAGADAEVALLADVAADPQLLHAAQILVVAGGFSYADALGAGRMWALELRHRLREHLQAFIDDGRPVIGICNGFQVLTAAGLLPGALGHNVDGRFTCRWVTLAAEPAGRCIWTSGIGRIECPIAHGEGRYVHPDPARLAADGQVALRYAGLNPNGSVGDIAGVCDATGLVLGLMPHPENHVVARQHPEASRRRVRGETTPCTTGLALFEQGVRHATER
jgi:phosphoribosylformylglycinamidine synthase subunit PurQ / glutaminase